MGNMDDYIGMTTDAKAQGGPEAYLANIASKGFNKGSVVTLALVGVAYVGKKFVWDKYAPSVSKKVSAAAAEAIAKAKTRGWNSVAETRKVDGDLTLTKGARFKALTRAGDVITIEVEGRADNPFPVSGKTLEEISDFRLSDIDD